MPWNWDWELLPRNAGRRQMVSITETKRATMAVMAVMARDNADQGISRWRWRWRSRVQGHEKGEQEIIGMDGLCAKKRITADAPCRLQAPGAFPAPDQATDPAQSRNTRCCGQSCRKSPSEPLSCLRSALHPSDSQTYICMATVRVQSTS